MARSSKEKQVQVGLLYGLGDIVRVEREGGGTPQFLVKNAQDQFGDAVTGEIYDVRDVADKILDPKTRKANQSDVREFRTLRYQVGQGKQNLILDTETAVRSSTRRIEANDIYQVAYKIPGTKKQESFVFEEVLKEIRNTRGTPYSPLLSMNDELRKVYEIADQVYRPENLEVKAGTHTLVSHKTFIGKFSEFADPNKTSMWAFNSPFDQNVLDTLYKSAGQNFPQKLNDVRGYELIRLAMLHPRLSLSAVNHMKQVYTPLLKRLNTSKAETDTIFQSMMQGLGSKYSTGTSLEALYHVYGHTLGRSESLLHEGKQAGDYVTERHVAEQDVNMTEIVKTRGDKVEELMQRERKGLISGDDAKYFSMRDRLDLGWLRYIWAKKKADNPMSQFSDVAEYLKMFDKHSDPTKEVKRLKASYEFREATKIERNIFKEARGAIGGAGSVSSLLGGAALAAGVGWATKKAELLLTGGQSDTQEGIGHNSLTTVARRMALTDFWSPHSAGISLVGSMAGVIAKTFKGLFVQMASGPTGSAVKEALTKINQHYAGIGPSKQNVKDAFAGDSLLNFYGDVLGHVGNIGTKFAESVKSSSFLSDKAKLTIHDSIKQKVEDLHKFSKGIGTMHPSLKKEGSMNLVREIGKRFITREGNKIKLTPYSAAALFGVGGFMLLDGAAGRYDPDKVPSSDDIIANDKVFNPQMFNRDQTSLMMKISDIQNSANNGLIFGSSQRQMSRNTFSDFGSRMGDLVRESGDPRMTLEVAHEMVAGKIPRAIYGYKEKHGPVRRTSPPTRVFDRAPDSVHPYSIGEVKDVRDFRGLGKAIAQTKERFASLEAANMLNVTEEQITAITAREQTKNMQFIDKERRSEIRRNRMTSMRADPKLLSDIPPDLIEASMNVHPYSKKSQLYQGMLSGIDSRFGEFGRGRQSLHQIGNTIKDDVRITTQTIDGNIGSPELVEIVPKRVTHTGDIMPERLLYMYGSDIKNMTRKQVELLNLELNSSRSIISEDLMGMPRARRNISEQSEESEVMNTIVRQLSEGPYAGDGVYTSINRNNYTARVPSGKGTYAGFGLSEIPYNNRINQMEMRPQNRQGWQSGTSMYDERPDVFVSKGTIIR